MLKTKSLVFVDSVTEENNQISAFSKTNLSRLNDGYKNTFSAANAFCNYITEKHRTKELGYQLAARRVALDAELDEAEQQLKINFENFKKRLEIEYQAELKLLNIELKKEQKIVGEKLISDRLAYEAYVKTSSVLRSVFNTYHKFAMDVSDQIKIAQDNNETHNKRYMQLCDEHRIFMNQLVTILKDMEMEV